MHECTLFKTESCNAAKSGVVLASEQQLALEDVGLDMLQFRGINL
jgi:uncharacterized protein (DUF362 family)